MKLMAILSFVLIIKLGESNEKSNLYFVCLIDN